MTKSHGKCQKLQNDQKLRKMSKVTKMTRSHVKCQKFLKITNMDKNNKYFHNAGIPKSQITTENRDFSTKKRKPRFSKTENRGFWPTTENRDF